MGVCPSRSSPMARPIMRGASLKVVDALCDDALLKKGRGTMLGLMVGDALGAAVEGFPPEEIVSVAKEHCEGSTFIQNYIRAVPMGTFVPGQNPGEYREARKPTDANFVRTGPTSNPDLLRQCSRFGMYTDDTCSCLAIARAIVQAKRADAEVCAESCARLFLQENEHFRGCPPTAKNTLALTLQGVSPAETGVPPHFPFPGGSFANGGAMRITPLALAYRNADENTMRTAVSAAIFASHRHPEAVDFAVVQASAVQKALKMQPAEFNPDQFLEELTGLCEIPDMQAAIQRTRIALQEADTTTFESEYKTLAKVVGAASRPGSGMGFQIASIHMMPCVLWCVCKYHQEPRMAIQMAIAIGGDTDTTAMMVGGIVGALHGDDFLRDGPVDWLADLENGKHGKDFACTLAQQLLELDLE